MGKKKIHCYLCTGNINNFFLHFISSLNTAFLRVTLRIFQPCVQRSLLCYQVKTFSFSSSKRNIYNLNTSHSISQSFRSGPLKPYQKWSDSPPRATFHLWMFNGLNEFFKYFWVFKISRAHHLEHWNLGCQLKCKAPASCTAEVGYHHLLLEVRSDLSPLPHGSRMIHRHMAAVQLVPCRQGIASSSVVCQQCVGAHCLTFLWEKTLNELVHIS